MKRSCRFRPDTPALTCTIALLLLTAAAPVTAGVVEDSGIRGGLVVILGCDRPDVILTAAKNERFLVQALDTDPKRIEKVREAIRKAGAYGRVSATTFNGNTLPYADNLVNDWSHFLCRPDNNAVTADTTVGMPRSLQWVADPMWARSHEQMASASALVSSGGRVLYIEDLAPRVSIRYMADWKLTCRDAFNGVLLWQRDIGRWSDHLRHFRAGPVHLPRRLVAVAGKVYVTISIGAPVTVLDAATGETLRTLAGTERTDEILVSGDTAYLVVGTSEVHRSGSGDSFYARGEPGATDYRFIKAVDLKTDRELWRKELSGRIMVVDSEGIFGYGRATIGGGPTGHKADGYHLYRVDRDDAPKLVWSDTDPLIVRAMVKAGDKLIVAGPVDLRKKSPELLAYDNEEEAQASCFGEKGVKMRVLNAADGKTLWESDIDAVPAFDGLAVANGRAFLALKSGEVQCWE